MKHQIKNNDIQAIAHRTLAVFNPDEYSHSSMMSKSILGRSVAMWLCEDLLPFNVVSGEGFKKFMLRHKIVQSENEIPSNVCISTSCLNDVYTLVRQRFCAVMNKAPRVINFTTDLWTAKHGSIPYITLCVRFLDENLVIYFYFFFVERSKKSSLCIFT